MRGGKGSLEMLLGNLMPLAPQGFQLKDKWQDPVETDVDFSGPHSTAPVQETLHGCQPVTQEDGKESRISVQERQ